MARAAIEARLLGRRAKGPLVPGGAVQAGAFVTLYHEGALRGCIGHLEADRPLRDTVAEMAIAAATEDPRFPPLGPHELEGLSIEISVLSPMRPAAAEDVVIGRHGVVVRRGERQGVYLPSVAVDQAWDRERLLSETCRKAGLPADAWQHGRAEVLVFEVQVLAAPAR